MKQLGVWHLCFAAITSFWFVPTLAVAAGSLEINVEQVRVYSQPDANSEVITTLFRGDSVPVSSKSPEGFKKVLIREGSSKRVGYIKNSDLGARSGGARNAPTGGRTAVKSARLKSLGGHGGFGVY